MVLDGEKLRTPFITYSQIMNGEKLVFEMSDRPVMEAFEDN